MILVVAKDPATGERFF